MFGREVLIKAIERPGLGLRASCLPVLDLSVCITGIFYLTPFVLYNNNSSWLPGNRKAFTSFNPIFSKSRIEETLSGRVIPEITGSFKEFNAYCRLASAAS